MGFGYLLIGYFLALAFSLANVYFFFDIIGGAVMLVGLSKLAAHGKNFYRALLLDVAYILLCLVRTALPMLGILRTESIWFYVIVFAITLLTFVLQFFILAAIYYIAKQVSLENEMNKAVRNIKFLLLYGIPYVVCLLSSLIGLDLGLIGNIVFIASVIFGYVVLFMNLLLIHSCYCRICLAGQESGERPQSRFAWLNRFHEKTDKLFDSAYLRQKKQDAPSAEAEAAEPGYRRVKRKKKSKRK